MAVRNWQAFKLVAYTLQLLFTYPACYNALLITDVPALCSKRSNFARHHFLELINCIPKYDNDKAGGQNSSQKSFELTLPLVSQNDGQSKHIKQREILNTRVSRIYSLKLMSHILIIIIKCLITIFDKFYL